MKYDYGKRYRKRYSIILFMSTELVREVKAEAKRRGMKLGHVLAKFKAPDRRGLVERWYADQWQKIRKEL